MFCSVEFFSVLTGSYGPGKNLQWWLVCKHVGVYKCTHMLMKTSTRSALCCKNSFKVSPWSILGLIPEIMRNINVGCRRQTYLCINQKGKTMFLKEEPKINAMITLNCLTRHYFLSVSLSFLPFSSLNIVLVCSQSWFETCIKKRLQSAISGNY